MRDSRLLVKRALMLIGVTCLGWIGFVTLHAMMYQQEQTKKFERLRAAQALPGPPAPLVANVRGSGDDTNLIGLLDIPRLAVSMPIVSGDDDATLTLAAGHLPDTPRPWEPGNSAIAGHRDGLFRPLKDIRVGDDVLLRTTRGDLRYRVRDTKVVRPDDLSVLSRTKRQRLTLITCYPFYYVGAAPKRFVVHADRVDNLDAPPARTVAKAASARAEKPSTEKRKLRKVSQKRSVDKRKPSKSVRGLSPEPAPEKKSRNVFRKIGGFFKKAIAPRPPA